jgi:hypothetical protein
MALKELLLNEVMEAFIGKVDGKLIEGIGSRREVMGPGKVKKTDESDEIIPTEAFIDVFIKP